MSKEILNSEIVQFVYDYKTMDPDVIRQAIPDAEVYSAEDIQGIIQEDFELMSRKIEHDIHPDYQGVACAY